MIDIAGALAIERGDGSGADMLFWAQATLDAIEAHRHDLAAHGRRCRCRSTRLETLENAARSMALAMDFGFLLDHEPPIAVDRFLAPQGALDANCYDLLASEARLASFFAIAKGDVSAKHWFRLGRAATPVGHGAALISWGGSMFEYLMPSLVMRAPVGSLLEQSNRLIVRRQIDYAAKLRPAVGNFRIGIQRPRSGIHLPILEFRRARTRLETRHRRGSGRRALRHGFGGDGRSTGSDNEPCAIDRNWARWAASASTMRSTLRRRGCLKANFRRSCTRSWRIIRA